MLKPSKTLGTRLVQLREGQCRWPVDDKQPAQRFCADITVGTTSWCAVHVQRAFAIPRERRDSARSGR
jgi:hypothetical protein